jgi:manganese/zinc/iron transport system permease protein
LSSSIQRLPTGPTIVLCISAIVVVSLFFAPRRGLIWRWVRDRRNRGRLHIEAILQDLYSLASAHENPEHAHSIAVLRLMSAGKGGVDKSLKKLQERGLVQSLNSGEWALTKAGIEEARNMIKMRGGNNS